VRGFLSGAVGNKIGLKLESTTREEAVSAGTATWKAAETHYARMATTCGHRASVVSTEVPHRSAFRRLKR
jgi:hypothetical protein